MEGNRDGADDNPNADTSVRVVVIAKTPDRLKGYSLPMWQLMMPHKELKPWTDDHTDILRALMPDE